MAFEKTKALFSNSFETNMISDPDYATHYYGNDYNTSKNAVIDAAKTLGYKVTNVDDQYKEILAVSRTHGEIIISLFTVSYYETAIDLKVTTHYVASFGRTKKKALAFYETLDRFLTLKRKGGTQNEY